jgi:S1-C subfamily serine protease
VLSAKEFRGSSPSVAFRNDIVPLGSPVASIGYPIPALTLASAAELEVDMTRRLSTGYVSSHEARHHLPASTQKELVYEFNMLSYPGNSGSPAFGLDGRVLGVNHATVLNSGGVAAFALASRSPEVLSWLTARDIKVATR